MKKHLPNKDNKFTTFFTNKKPDLLLLDEEIRQSLNAQKWQDNPAKEGYSGLSMKDFGEEWQGKSSGRYMIIVHWTLDGIVGFNVDFDNSDKAKIVSTIKSHKGLAV